MLFAILVYSFIVLYTDLSASLLTFLAFYIGALTPDLDHPKSRVSRKLKLVPKVINKIAGHRKLVHSIFGAALFSALVVFMLQFVGLQASLAFWFFGGFLSHLFLDSLTPHGIAWLYPFSKKKIRYLVRSGSWIENLFFIGLCTAGFLLIFRFL